MGAYSFAVVFILGAFSTAAMAFENTALYPLNRIVSRSAMTLKKDLEVRSESLIQNGRTIGSRDLNEKRPWCRLEARRSSLTKIPANQKFSIKYLYGSYSVGQGLRNEKSFTTVIQFEPNPYLNQLECHASTKVFTELDVQWLRTILGDLFEDHFVYRKIPALDPGYSILYRPKHTMFELSKELIFNNHEAVFQAGRGPFEKAPNIRKPFCGIESNEISLVLKPSAPLKIRSHAGHYFSDLFEKDGLGFRSDIEFARSANSEIPSRIFCYTDRIDQEVTLQMIQKTFGEWVRVSL